MALDHIRQVHIDAAGNQVSSTVQAYFQQLMSAARPFSSQQEFPVSVYQRFMDGLDPRLMTGFCRCFPNHSVPQPLNASHQHRMLQLMLQAAQQVEDNFASTQRIAQEAIGLSQAFPTNTTATGSTPQANAFPSQAETTLSRYAAGGGSCDGNTQNQGWCGDRSTLATVAAALMPIWNIGMVLQPSFALIATTRASKKMQHAIWKKITRTRGNVIFTPSSARTSVPSIMLTYQRQPGSG